MKRTKLKLKKVKLFLLALCFFTVSLSTFNLLPSFAAGPKHYDELTFPALPELKLPKYTRFELKNGMRVYLMEDKELPLVGGNAIFRTGERFEPSEKIGLANLTGTVMRTGGTKKHTSDELNQLLERRAASVETGISSTSGSANFTALAEDIEPVFDLFAEVIQQPIFAQEKLDLAKKQEQGGIARRNDNPDDITAGSFKS